MKWVRQAKLIERGPTTWITAARSTRLSAVSNAELPLPMTSTRWSTKSSGSTVTVAYRSVASIPGIGGTSARGSGRATGRPSRG